MGTSNISNLQIRNWGTTKLSKISQLPESWDPNLEQKPPTQQCTDSQDRELKETTAPKQNGGGQWCAG